MKFTKKFLALVLALTVLAGVAAAGTMLGTKVQAASSKTGAGLSEHVLKAYSEGWKYNYGSYGEFVDGQRATDCTGLIKSYLWWAGDSSSPKAGSVSVAGGASAMLNSASQSGTIDYSDSSSLPRIHGLILYQPGHVGVYVGGNMAVDNRDYGLDVKYEKVFGRAKNKWTTWFKLPQIRYPTTGWVTFDGDRFYYEDGEYIVNTTRTIDGAAYRFGSDGVATKTSGDAQASEASSEKDSVDAKAAAQAAKEDEQKQAAQKKAEAETAAKAAAEQKAAEEAEQAEKEAAKTQEEEEAPVSSSQETDSEQEEESGLAAAGVTPEDDSGGGDGSLPVNLSFESLQNVVGLALTAKNSSENPVGGGTASGGDDLVFADGVLPKASAQAKTFETVQQTKGMSSLLALIIVFLATGITAIVVFQVRARRAKAGYSSANARSFRNLNTKRRKK